MAPAHTGSGDGFALEVFEDSSQSRAHLGSWYNFNYYKGADRIPSDEEAKALDQEKPIFVHLEFRSHQEAWKAFDLLDNAYSSGASDLKVSWIKSEWYWKVAKRRGISASP